MLCAKFGWNLLTGSGEENEKVHDNVDNDDEQILIIHVKAQLSLNLKWAKIKKLLLKCIIIYCWVFSTSNGQNIQQPMLI